MTFLSYLPLDDVLYKYVFCHLTITDLFQMRASSRLFHNVVTDYFSKMEQIHSTPQEWMDKVAFEILTRDNFSIKTLVIHNINEWITDDLVTAIARNCENLRRIALRQCTNLSNQCLETLTKTCHHLHALDMSGCHWIDRRCFAKLVSRSTNLQEVKVGKCGNLNDISVELMAKCLPELRILDISEISQLSDQSLYVIARHCRKLTHLSIIGCWRMSDSGVSILAEYCKQLLFFNCLHCRDISEQALTALRSSSVIVDVEEVPHITLRRLENSLGYICSLVPPIHHNM